MRRFALFARMARRMPMWLVAVSTASVLAGLIWAHGGLTAKRDAEIEALQIERVVRAEHDRQSKELRDEFDQIEEDAAAGGDDAVLDRLRRGHFTIAPGIAASERQGLHPRRTATGGD